MSTSPGCGEYTAELVRIDDGTTQPIDLSLFKLSWERVMNKEANAVLTASDAVEQNPWCCTWDLEEWCYELRIRRSGRQVGSFDYHSIFRNPETDSDVLYFTTKMGLVGRRWWWNSTRFSGEATAAFTRVLQEADICDGLRLPRQPIPLGYDVVLNGYEYTPLDNQVKQLTSGTLDYTEYTLDEDVNVVRYGELCYETGATLIESDWDKQPPSIGVRGIDKTTAVVVTNDLKGTSVNRVYGYWPRTSSGEVDKGDHKRWLPTVLEVKDVETQGEAAAIAQRAYNARVSGKVIQSNSAAQLSKTFPVCIDELIPGAVFNVSIASGCVDASGKYMLQSLVFDVDGGREVSVKANLREKVY